MPIERGDKVRNKQINQEGVVTAGEHDGLVRVNLKGTIAAWAVSDCEVIEKDTTESDADQRSE